MNVHDYVTLEDVLSLSDDEYESFRNHLKFLGYRVSDKYGARVMLSVLPVVSCVILHRHGDLAWADNVCAEFHGGSRVPLEEVKRMAALGMLV